MNTTGRITDPDVRILANCSMLLQKDYAESAEVWEGSPFAWIRAQPSRKKGAIGEKLIAGWLATKGFDVVRSPDGDADRLVNGARVEIKFSTLWESGTYTFQQLRDQNYEFAICLGISPFDAHCWVLPKKIIMAQWGAGNGLATQHVGRRGADTAWLTVDPDSPHSWLPDYGGRLAKAALLVAKFSGRKPLP